MYKANTVLIFISIVLFSLSMKTPAIALGPCEKQAAQCNRQVDIEFRHNKEELGESEARNLVDRRRYECRSIMKKCKKVAAGRRDLRLGSGTAMNKGGFTPTSRTDTPTRY